MKNEAKANEAADKAEREKVDKMNQADSLIFQTEKQLKEYGDKISADKKSPIESALEKLKEAHKQQDVSNVDAATAELNNAWTAASEEMYKATQGQGPDGNANAQGNAGEGAQGQQSSEANPNDNVTDAEFEEVK
jgi:molecular chaperone DnaK